MRTFSRRDFHRLVGLSAFASPFLFPKFVSAAAGKAKYFVVFITQAPKPSLYEAMVPGQNNFNVMSEPLAAIKQDLQIVVNVRLENAGHGSPAPLTGGNYGFAGNSIETYIGDKLAIPGLRPSLLVGPRPGTPWFYRNNNGISPTASPAQVYTDLFGNMMPTPGASGPTTEEVIARLRKKQSMLDLVRGDINALAGKLSSNDRGKLQVHLESIRTFELTLDKALKDAAKAPPANNNTLVPPTENGMSVDKSLPLHFELIAHAFASDKTRCAGISIGDHQGCNYDNIPTIGPIEHHNQAIHSNYGRTAHIAVEHFLANEFVKFINKLKSLPMADGNGTVFDHTLVLWARDFGQPDAHTSDGAVYVLSGGAGGFLKKSNQALYQNYNNTVSHQRVLATVAQGMGVTDLSGIGNNNAGSKSPLPELIA